MAGDFTSTYVSDTFKNRVWSLFSSDLYRQNSKDAYRLAIDRICDYSKKDFLKLTSKDAQRYFDALAAGAVVKKDGDRYSSTSIYIFYSQLLAVSNYIMSEKELYSDLDYVHPFYSVRIKEPSNQVELSYTLTMGDMKNILSAFKGTDLYLIISFAFRLGLSSKMILNLIPSDVQLAGSGDYVLRIRPESKLKRDKFLAVPDDLTNDIKKYMESLPMSCKTLFHNSRNDPLTRKTLDLKLKTETEKIGYTKVTLQRIRTSAGFHMRKNGATPEELSLQLGINERWVYRYNGAVEDLANQASRCIKME